MSARAAGLALALALVAGSAAAVEGMRPGDEIVAPGAFVDWAEGYTLYFEHDGAPFGAERFGPDNSSTWRYQDGSCVEGVWRVHGAQLCFFYGQGREVLCWRMLRRDGSYVARLLGDGPDAGMELVVTGRDREPLLCSDPGPEL